MAASQQHHIEAHFYLPDPELLRAHACSAGGKATA